MPVAAFEEGPQGAATRFAPRPALRCLPSFSQEAAMTLVDCLALLGMAASVFLKELGYVEIGGISASSYYDVYDCIEESEVRVLMPTKIHIIDQAAKQQVTLILIAWA